MNKFKNKLRSRAGASMILAMVFMLFCSFVGSTVLASATANAQRVAQLAEQQDFMLQRSAALLVSDQFRMDAGQYLRMSVVDQEREIRAIQFIGGGVYEIVPGELKKDRVITFTVLSSKAPTELQQLMLESAVLRYLRENASSVPDDVTLKVELAGFPGNPASTADFLFPQPTGDDYEEKGIINGTMNVAAELKQPAGTAPAIPDYSVRFSVGQGQYLYDFILDFGENSQVKMTMDAFSGVDSGRTMVTKERDESFFADYPDVEITSETETTMISWENPLVEKGGVQ
jgi:hypothetical protein